MKATSFLVKYWCYIFLMLAFVGPANAHEGHDHAPEQETAALTGPVQVSEQARKNLELEVVPAKIEPIEEVLKLVGTVEALPEKSAVITSRIAGQISRVFVSDGQIVAKGADLVEVESRQVGDPPPRTIIKAPLAGTVTDLGLSPGDSVDTERSLLRVIDLSEVYVHIQLHENQVARAQVGRTARVQISSFPEHSFAGELKVIAGELNPTTRSLSGWIKLNNIDGRLKPNMTATANLVLDQVESAIVVPRSAVLGEFGNYFVFVQSETNADEFERRFVILGKASDQSLEIIEGLLPGELVVTKGNYQLQYLAGKPTSSEHQAEEHSHGVFYVLIWILVCLVVASLLMLGYIKFSGASR